MSKFPAIPDFSNDIESMGTSLRAAKQTLEILAGQRQGESLGAPQVFVQSQAPALASRGANKRGDLWIDTSDDSLNYWNGTTWKKLS